MAGYEYSMYVEVSGVVSDVGDMPMEQMGTAIGNSMNQTLARVVAGIQQQGGGWEIMSHQMLLLALGSRVVFSFLLRRPK